MQYDIPDILASRLNFDVIVFRGNTRKELIVIAIVSLLVTAFILGLIAQLILGMMMVGIGLSFPCAIAVGWGIATLMQKLKEGKPKGYLKQKTLLWLDKHGLKKSVFIRHSGKWVIKRGW